MSNLVFIGTARKSQKQESIDPRSRHIVEWCEASDSARNKALGETFAKNAEDLYNLQDAMTPGPVQDRGGGGAGGGVQPAKFAKQGNRPEMANLLYRP